MKSGSKGATPGYSLSHPAATALAPVNYSGNLSPYLNTQNYPNIVVIIVEGLGRDFMGPDAVWWIYSVP